MAHSETTSGRLVEAHRSHERRWRDNRYVYGVVSRRSRGLSIGINLNPGRECDFDCVYCQVDRRGSRPPGVDFALLERELDGILRAERDGSLYADRPFSLLDAAERGVRDLAFSGDGEPTLHPRLAEVCLRALAKDPAARFTTARDLATAPAALTLTLVDSRGSQSIAMETAVADNGDLVAFTTLMPTTPGNYTISAPGAEILVQDRWDPDLSRRGRDQVQARCCEGTELFIRFAPTATPEARAALLPDGAAAWVSVLRNGGFEAGIPAYPPRSWTISHPRRMGFSWPYWSQEQPHTGASALKFVRPEVAMSLNAQPMRLLVGGRYRLRFHAMGNASTVEVSVSGARGARTAVKVEPATEWRAYETELDLLPGYTQITIAFGNGGEPDQVLWLDDIDLSRRVDGVAATQP